MPRGLGIHNFHLGFTNKVLTLLRISVSSAGLPAWAMAIWVLAEGIPILAGNDGFRTGAGASPPKD